MAKTVVYAWPKEKNEDKNSYNKILYDEFNDSYIVKEFDWKKIDPADCDVLHLHWPDAILRSSHWIKIRLNLWRFKRLLSKIKKNKGKIIWTVHNLEPHQYHYPNLVSKGMKKIASICDGFIFLSNESKDYFFENYPYLKAVPSVIIPHIHYREYYDALEKQNALHALIKQPKTLQILCFGVIRKHKGYERLFNLIPSLNNASEIDWLVAGNPGKNGVSSELAAAFEKAQVAYSAYRHISHDEIPYLFAAADAVLLTYEKILNSGTAILALSLNRRVIAPSVGSLVELQAQVGSYWVYLYDQPLTKEKLESAIEWARQNNGDKSIPDLDFMSPRLIAEKTTDFYDVIINHEE